MHRKPANRRGTPRRPNFHESTRAIVFSFRCQRNQPSNNKGWLPGMTSKIKRSFFNKLEVIDNIHLESPLLAPCAVVIRLGFINSRCGTALATMCAARMLIPEFRAERQD